MDDEEEKHEDPEHEETEHEETGEVEVEVSPGIGLGSGEAGDEEEEEEEEDLQEIVLFLQLEMLRPFHDLWDTVNRWNYGLQQDYSLQHRRWAQPALPKVSATALGDFKFLMTTENKEGYLLFDKNTTTNYKSVVDYCVDHAPSNKTVLKEILLSREFYPDESSHEAEGRNETFLLPAHGSPQQGCLLLCAIDARLEDITVIFTRLSNPLKGALSASVRFVFIAAGPEHEKDKCLELCHACAAIMCDSRFVAKIYDLDTAGFRQMLSEELKQIVLAPNLKLTAWFKNNLYAGVQNVETGAMEVPQHLFTQLDEYRPQGGSSGWHQNIRHWNFGLEQERQGVSAWKKPRLPVMDVWSVVQLTLALDEFGILFDVSPSTANSSSTEDQSGILTLRCIVVSALDRLEEMDRITPDDHHTAKHAFLARLEDGAGTLPVANSVLSPSRAQEGLLCLVGTANVKTPVIAFARLTYAANNLLTERECPVRFVFLLLLPSDARNPDVRRKLALKLGKSFADMFCDERLMATALSCVSAKEFLDAFNERISCLSIVRVTSMENHKVLKNPEIVSNPSRNLRRQKSKGLGDSVFNATEFYAKESQGQKTGRYVRRRGASMSSYDSDRSRSSFKTSFVDVTKTSLISSTSVERERDDIEQLFVNKLTKDVQSKRRRYRWDLHHLPTLSKGCSGSNVIRWLVKYSIPLLLGVVLGMLLTNTIGDVYFNAVTHSRAGPFFCFPEFELPVLNNDPNISLVYLDPWWGNEECWRFFGLPVTINLFVNDFLMCLYFAIAASHLREMAYESPAKVRAAGIAAAGAISGSIAVYFVVLAAGAGAASPTFKGAKDGWAVGAISSAPLTWLVGMAVYGRRHSAVNLIVLISIFTEGFALIALAAFYGRPGRPWDPFFLLAILGGVAVTLGLRYILHINWYAPYILVGGGLSWIGCALSGIYPGLALIPIIAFMPREVLLFNSYPYVFFQWITGQLSVMNIQDRNPRGSILQPRLRRSTMSRSHLSKSHDRRSSFESQRSEIGFIMQPEERFNRCCQGDRYRMFKGALVRFEHDFEFPVQYMLFFFGLVAANIRFDLLINNYGTVLPFNSPVFLAVFLSSFLGKLIGIPFTLFLSSKLGLIKLGLENKDIGVVALTSTISLTISFIVAERGFRQKIFEIEAKLAILACGLVATGLMGLYAGVKAGCRKLGERSRARQVRRDQREMSAEDLEMDTAKSFENFETILKEEMNQDLADVIAEFLEKKLERRQIKSRAMKQSRKLKHVQDVHGQQEV